MSKQDKQKPNNQQPVIEDLALNETASENVKGGIEKMELTVERLIRVS